MSLLPFAWLERQSEIAAVPVHPFERTRQTAEFAEANHETADRQFYAESVQRMAAGDALDVTEAARFRVVQKALSLFDQEVRDDVDRVQRYRALVAAVAAFGTDEKHAAQQRELQSEFDSAVAAREKIERETLPQAQERVNQSYDALCLHVEQKRNRDALHAQYPHLCP